MVSCPHCESPELATIRGGFGSPAFPIRCKSCGTEFHSSFFWYALLTYASLGSIAFISTFVLIPILGSSVALILSFGTATFLAFFLGYIMSKRQTLVTTKPFVKNATRLTVLIALAYFIGQILFDLHAA